MILLCCHIRWGLVVEHWPKTWALVLGWLWHCGEILIPSVTILTPTPVVLDLISRPSVYFPSHNTAAQEPGIPCGIIMEILNPPGNTLSPVITLLSLQDWLMHIHSSCCWRPGTWGAGRNVIHFNLEIVQSSNFWYHRISILLMQGILGGPASEDPVHHPYSSHRGNL